MMRAVTSESIVLESGGAKRLWKERALLEVQIKKEKVKRFRVVTPGTAIAQALDASKATRNTFPVASVTLIRSKR